MTMPDKYDRAIEYLEAHPGQIQRAWNYPQEHPAGCLFTYATSNGLGNSDSMCGCLTQIKSGDFEAETPELTAEIRSDDELPADVLDITPAHLPIFAEWQRKIDELLGRE